MTFSENYHKLFNEKTCFNATHQYYLIVTFIVKHLRTLLLTGLAEKCIIQEQKWMNLKQSLWTCCTNRYLNILYCLKNYFIPKQSADQ